MRLSRITILCLGPGAAVLCYFMLPDLYSGAAGTTLTFSSSARWTVGCMVWMAIWWLLEPLPLPVTSLLPVSLFPLLGVASLADAAAPYADPLLFLFLGGFVLATAIEKWGLHRRFAFSLLALTGGDAHRLVLAIMGSTAFISLWLSNTATAVLMLPVALSIARLDPTNANLGRCLMLGVAYSATIGGMGTLIGTPPNIFVASFLRSNYHVTVEFESWLAVGLPVVATLLPLTWWLLVRVRFPLQHLNPLELPAIGENSLRWSALSPPARMTFVIFVTAALAWVSRSTLVTVDIAGARPFQALSDAGIALLATLGLFAIPVGRGRAATLEWSDTQQLPWGTLLLFGGGLSLAAAITANGVDRALGAVLAGVPVLPKPLVLAAIAATVIFVSEIASNIATVAALTPILAAAAPALGLTATEAAITTALAASSAFMMPVGTAPNALAYGSGLVSTKDMATTGIMLNLVSIGLITAVVMFIVPLLWD